MKKPNGISVFFVLTLCTVRFKLATTQSCPTRDEDAATTEDSTRKCRKGCTDNSACSGLKSCNCDNLCGMSCFNPDLKCPDINLTGGEITYTDGNNYDSEATHSCNEGYYFTGQKTRRCRSKDGWSHSDSIPNCERGCIPPKNSLGSSFISTGDLIGQVGYPVGHTVTYQCQTGYDSSGSGVRTCQSDFNWSNLQLHCTVKNCGEPISVNHGSYDVTKQTFGGTARFNCDTGYDAEGTTTFRCMSQGEWEPVNSWPSCKIRTCVPAVAPENGYSVGGSNREYGNTVDYHCNPGYKLIGPAKGTCNENGTWGEKPTCNVTLDVTFNNAHLDGYEVVDGSSWKRTRVEKNYEGLPGYVLQGDGTIQSLPYPLTGQEKVCMEAYVKDTKKNELQAIAHYGDKTKILHTFSTSDSWKLEKFWLTPADPSQTKVQLQFVAPAGSNVFLDEVAHLDDAECASVTSTTISTTQQTSPTTTTRQASSTITTQQTSSTTTSQRRPSSTTTSGNVVSPASASSTTTSATSTEETTQGTVDSRNVPPAEPTTLLSSTIKPPSQSLPVGTIVGIVVGVFLVAGIIVAVVVKLVLSGSSKG